MSNQFDKPDVSLEMISKMGLNASFTASPTDANDVTRVEFFVAPGSAQSLAPNNALGTFASVQSNDGSAAAHYELLNHAFTGSDTNAGGVVNTDEGIYTVAVEIEDTAGVVCRAEHTLSVSRVIDVNAGGNESNNDYVRNVQDALDWINNNYPGDPSTLKRWTLKLHGNVRENAKVTMQSFVDVSMHAGCIWRVIADAPDLLNEPGLLIGDIDFQLGGMGDSSIIETHDRDSDLVIRVENATDTVSIGNFKVHMRRPTAGACFIMVVDSCVRTRFHHITALNNSGAVGGVAVRENTDVSFHRCSSYVHGSPNASHAWSLADQTKLFHCHAENNLESNGTDPIGGNSSCYFMSGDDSRPTLVGCTAFHRATTPGVYSSAVRIRNNANVHIVGGSFYSEGGSAFYAETGTPHLDTQGYGADLITDGGPVVAPTDQGGVVDGNIASTPGWANAPFYNCTIKPPHPSVTFDPGHTTDVSPGIESNVSVP